MRILLFLIFATLVFGCKKEISKAKPLDNKSKLNNLILDSNQNTNVKTVKKDTIFFNYDEQTKHLDYALISLLAKNYNKDSVVSASFQIDFMSKNKLLYSHKLKINSMDNGSEWFGNLELDSISSPLKRISLGYPACGYLQHNFLFYVNSNSNSNLIHQWDSMSDSGWGTWGEIVSGKPDDFVFRTESFSPKEDAIEDIGIAEYSDSLHFTLANKQWKKSYKTPKGKIYRSSVQSFDEFHK